MANLKTMKFVKTRLEIHVFELFKKSYQSTKVDWMKSDMKQKTRKQNTAENPNTYTPEVNIFITGSNGVGKTAIYNMYVENNFSTDPPSPEDGFRKVDKIDGKTYYMRMCDLSNEYSSFMKDQMYRVNEGFLVVYDITNLTSFTEVADIIRNIYRIRESEFPFVLVGNKCDLEAERSVTRDMLHDFATKELWNVPYFETSAKMNKNIQECVAELVREIVKKRDSQKQQPVKKSCIIL